MPPDEGRPSRIKRHSDSSTSTRKSRSAYSSRNSGLSPMTLADMPAVFKYPASARDTCGWYRRPLAGADRLQRKEADSQMRVRTLPPAWGITVVRVIAGFIITVAALEKFNAGGFDGFTRVAAGLGIPAAGFWGVFIPLLELIGGLMVLLGVGARWVAVLFVIEYAITSFALKAPRQPPFGG